MNNKRCPFVGTMRLICFIDFVDCGDEPAAAAQNGVRVWDGSWRYGAVVQYRCPDQEQSLSYAICDGVDWFYPESPVECHDIAPSKVQSTTRTPPLATTGGPISTSISTMRPTFFPTFSAPPITTTLRAETSVVIAPATTSATVHTATTVAATTAEAADSTQSGPEFITSCSEEAVTTNVTEEKVYILQSPNWPRNYANSKLCNWVLEVRCTGI